MCCGRGYDTTRVKQITKCECKFKWCCAVECKDCEEAVDIHTCKAPKRAEWLDQTWRRVPSAPRNATPSLSPFTGRPVECGILRKFVQKYSAPLSSPAPTSVHHCMAFSTTLFESTRIQYPSIWINTHLPLFVNGPLWLNCWDQMLDGSDWAVIKASVQMAFLKIACGSGLKMVCCFHDALKTHFFFLH